jgi:alpha-galactosidase
VSVGSATPRSKVFKEHPEWFVKDKKGNFANLQVKGNSDEIRSACFSTGWKDYIKKILLKLAVDYGLEYLKLDFAVVTSPFRYSHEASGCYATDHSGHKITTNHFILIMKQSGSCLMNCMQPNPVYLLIARLKQWVDCN